MTSTTNPRVGDHGQAAATFQRAGVRLWCRLVGRGPTVILHTGAGGDSDMFELAGYVDALTHAGYRVVCFDHRGHGRSDKPRYPEAHRTEEYVADVVGLLDMLEVEAAAIVGYSQGRQVATATAAAHPDRIAAVVGIGTVRAPDDDPGGSRKAAAQRVRASGTRVAIQELSRSEPEPPPRWLTENLSSTDSEVFALLLEADPQDRTRAWHQLANVHAPTLLVVGECEENDAQVEPGLAVRRAGDAATAMPRAEVLAIAGQGHLGVFWRADLTLPAILDFLRRHYAPPLL